MSTTTKMSRGKPVTLAKSASGEPVSTKTSAKKPPATPAKAEAGKPKSAGPAATPTVLPDLPPITDPVLAAKWNELLKAQSDAAMAWWHDAKDARTFADAIAVNTRHSRAQLELAAGQAREMATYFQKSFEGNAERIRALLMPGDH